MSYLLDTDVIIDYLRGNEKVVNKLIEISSDNLCISVINLSELFYGIYNSDKQDKHIQVLSDFLANVEVLDINLKVCRLFGKLKASLKKKGKIIDNFDLLIGAVCLDNNSVLVTNNTKHFEKVVGIKLLKVED